MKIADIKTYVLAELLAQEGNTAQDATILGFANEALNEMSEALHPLPKLWLGTDFSGVTSNNGVYTATLPTNWLGPIDAVRYDGHPVCINSVENIEEYRDGTVSDLYYTYAITGREIRSTAPLSAAFRMSAYQYAPLHTSITDTNDRFAVFGQGASLMPCYYVLSRLAVPDGVDVARERQERNLALWNATLERLRFHAAQAKGRRFTGR